MRKKNNFNFLRSLFLLTIVICLASCKKEEPPKFSGDNFLYFINRNVTNPDVTNIVGAYSPVMGFSFLQGLYQMDTLRTNEVLDFPLFIQTDGKLSSKNRPILLELEGNGKEYAVLPNSDSIYIKANEVQYKLNLKLVRPSLSDTGLKTLTVILKNSKEFKPEHHTWNKVVYVFGNLLTLPRYYYVNEPIYGPFSPAKMYTLMEAVNRKGVSYWKNNNNVNTLNNYIILSDARPLKFDPFTLNDLYNFIDLQELLRDMNTGPIREAYNDFNNEMISLSKELLIEKRNAGNPVVDQTGKEISFP